MSSSELQFRALDRLVTGGWWWAIRRKSMENRLNNSPEESPESDDAYTKWKHFDFAFRFGRPVDLQTAEAIKQAALASNSEGPLALLVVNKDVSLVDGKLQYRQGRLLEALSWSSKAVCIWCSMVISASLALAPIAITPKLLAFVAVFAVLIACAYIWELHFSRPLKAAKYLTEQTCASVTLCGDNVISLPTGLGSNPKTHNR